jgi:hypothetical protein
VLEVVRVVRGELCGVEGLSEADVGLEVGEVGWSERLTSETTDDTGAG